MIQIITLGVIAIFPISEITLALLKRSGGQDAQSKDLGSMRLLWLSIVIGICLAIAAQWIHYAHLPGTPRIIYCLALSLMLAGLILRWAAILTLGSLFTADVAIRSDHVVYQSGLYSLVRHPSYTGLMITFLGLGVFFSNWLSILGLLTPISFALINRVVKEEQALIAALGAKYESYCLHTKRFIPGLF